MEIEILEVYRHLRSVRSFKNRQHFPFKGRSRDRAGTQFECEFENSMNKSDYEYNSLIKSDYFDIYITTQGFPVLMGTFYHTKFTFN